LATTPTYTAITEGTGKKMAASTYTENSQVVLDQKVILGEPYEATYMATAAGVSLTTANAHLMEIMAGASLNVRIRRVEVGQIALATVAAAQLFQLVRLTSAGTGGGLTVATPFDTADAASGATAMTLPSVKGAEGGSFAFGTIFIVQTVGVSGSTTQPALVWDFDQLRSKPIILAAGTTNGIAIRTPNAGTAPASVFINVFFTETSY
jgi:hypothetical protein